MQFLGVYIREAHPVDGWWLGKPVVGAAVKTLAKHVATDVYDPKSMSERSEVAIRCSDTLQYGFPTLVDTLGDAVNKAYAAWPTRLYLIDITGVVIYRGGPGPFGFKPASFASAIEEHLSTK